MVLTFLNIIAYVVNTDICCDPHESLMDSTRKQTYQCAIIVRKHVTRVNMFLRRNKSEYQFCWHAISSL